MCDEAATKAQEQIAKPEQIVKKKVISKYTIKYINIFDFIRYKVTALFQTFLILALFRYLL